MTAHIAMAKASERYDEYSYRNELGGWFVDDYEV